MPRKPHITFTVSSRSQTPEEEAQFEAAIDDLIGELVRLEVERRARLRRSCPLPTESEEQPSSD